MNAFLTLKQGDAKLDIDPGFGGSILRLSVADRPVLRPVSPNGPKAAPFDVGAIILLPFSNRIAGGSFEWRGNVHAVERNLAIEPFPIHGDGFQRHWSVIEHSATRIHLACDDGNIGPFRYMAGQIFELSEDAFTWRLEIENRADIALPYGFGFHPWFPCTKDTRLRFQARTIALSDSLRIPRERKLLTERPEFDFSIARALPDFLIDNGYEGWDGTADIEQGEQYTSVRLDASSQLSTAILYSPEGDGNFFCLEPVSHPINAHNEEGKPGLITLEPGTRASAWMTLRW